MAFTEALRMLITADTGQAITSIRGVAAATDKELGKSTKTIDKWSRGLTVAGAGMVAFGAAALVGLAHAAKSAVDLGEAVNASNVVFGEASGVIDKYAKDSATSMGLSERAFRQALIPVGAMLQNFGFSAEEAAEKSVELGQRAADMASVFNTDVTTALEAIQAGLRGESDPLEKFGVGLNEAAVNAKAMELGLATSTTEVDAGAKAQARLALIMEQTSKFQGDFANTSDSLANKQRILAARFENLKAAIGEGALPVFETFMNVADKGISAFESLNAASGGTLGKFAAFGAVGLIAAGGLSLVVGQLLKMRQNFADAASAARGLVSNLGGVGRIAKVTGGLIAIGLTAELIKLNSDRFPGITKLPRDLEQITKATRELNSAGASNAEAVNNWMIEVGNLDDAFNKILESSPGLAESFLQAAEAAGVPAEKLRELRGQLKEKIGVDAEATASQDEYNAKVAEAAGVTEDATSKLQEYSDTMKGLVDPVFAAMDAITGVRDAQLAEADAAVAVMEAQEALNEAREGGKAEEIAEAERGLADAQRQLSDAQWATVQSAAEADAALAGLQDAVENGDVSVDEFKDTLATWVRQGFLTQQQANTAAREVAGLGDAAADADKERVDIPVKTPGAPESRTNLTKVRDAAHSIPSRRNTHVSASGTRTARSNILDVVGAVFALPTSRTVYINVAGAAAAANALARAGPRQHGGPVLAGKAYVVGEAGPELLLMGDKSGHIVPNGAFGRTMGGMGGGGHGGGGGVVVNVSMAGAIISSNADARRWVADAWNKAAETGLVHVRGRSV